MSSNENNSIEEVSAKNTKAEILDAYEELLERYKKQASTVNEKEKAKQQQDNNTLVAKAGKLTPTAITQQSTTLLGDITAYFTQLRDQLTAEANKLTELQQAIAIEEQRLKEIHDIQVAAGTLAQLIQSHEEYKQTTEKERKREEDEYTYTLKQQRKREEDEYQQRRTQQERELKETQAQQEKEWQEREQRLTDAEQELNDLRSQVATFGERMAEAVSQSEARLQTELEASFQHQQAIKEAGYATQRREAEITIESLREKIAEQQALISSLSTQLAAANDKVETIAKASIEGAAGATAFQSVNRIAIEQARKQAGRQED